MVWGISKWRDWESCPRMFKAKHVDKTWQDTPSPAMERGRKVHNDLELAIRLETELPSELAHMQSIVDTLCNLRKEGAVVTPEKKLGIDVHGLAVDFFRGPRLRVRAAFDVVVDNHRRFLVVDWKTGRPKDEHRADAMFYGACAGSAYGALTVDVMYAYVDEPDATFIQPVKEISKELAIWEGRFASADTAIGKGEVEIVTGPHCRWCGFAACPHNRNEKLK